MNILLVELPHQEQALAAILSSFPGFDHAQAALNHYSTPLIKQRDDHQPPIHFTMEPGPGKTYVSTRLLHE
ncbi:hypothetical protein, partial [Salmonella enterica]|uniref:hypothetical protein n=1 Tax=Salmonella enterica TaxID=28901 RepID=UPI001CB7CA09